MAAKTFRSLAFAAALAIVAAIQTLPAAPALSQLGGIQELGNWFNAARGHPRLIFLLSPT